MNLLNQTLEKIKPLNEEAAAKALERYHNLTMPTDALGRIGQLAIKVAGITGQAIPEVPQKTLILMAGDHGVVEEGVSAYPQEVTPQMVANFGFGGAAINVFCRHAGADLILVDVGVAADLPDIKGLIKRKVAYGTKNMTKGPAMTREEAVQALEVGIEIAQGEIAKGAGLLGLGDMGIGNTTPSSALVAFIGNITVEESVGRGTGVDDEHLALKIAAIKKAIAVNQPDPKDPLDILAKLGGLEIAGLAGVVLAAAAARVPVIVDGLISTAAALVACQFSPLVKKYLIGSHLSVEPGHKHMLSLMELDPILMGDMRLGEGTGGALTMTLVDAGIKALKEMSTFEEAMVNSTKLN